MEGIDSKQSSLESDKRNTSVDIIKGLGIFCMVFGHSGFPYIHFVYLFHMSIFFIAAGYCYKQSNSDTTSSTVKFIKRKISTLWFPFVVWNVIYKMLHNFFIDINIYTNNPEILMFGQCNSVSSYMTIKEMAINAAKSFLFYGGTQMGGALWFLRTLMEVSVMYCCFDLVLKKLFDKKYSLLLQGLISILFLSIGYLLNVNELYLWGFGRTMTSYCLFYMGCICKSSKILNKERKLITHLMLLLISFFILWTMDSRLSINLDRNSYNDPFSLIAASFIGWQFLYEIAEFIKRIEIIKKFWIIIGKNTLAIVVLHFLCFKVVSYIRVIVKGEPKFIVAAFPVVYSDGIWWFAYLMTGVLLPVLLNVLWGKLFKYINENMAFGKVPN